MVENVAQSDPSLFTLKALGGQRLANLLSKAKEQRYFTVPWPVADYDRALTAPDAEDAIVREKPAHRPHSAETAPEEGGVQIFDAGDEPYIDWIDPHPNGCVLNVLPSITRSGMKLDRADCAHIITDVRAHPLTPSAATFKVCSEDADELRR